MFRYQHRLPRLHPTINPLPSPPLNPGLPLPHRRHRTPSLPRAPSLHLLLLKLPLPSRRIRGRGRARSEGRRSRDGGVGWRTETAAVDLDGGLCGDFGGGCDDRQGGCGCLPGQVGRYETAGEYHIHHANPHSCSPRLSSLLGPPPQNTRSLPNPSPTSSPPSSSTPLPPSSQPSSSSPSLNAYTPSTSSVSSMTRWR